MSWRIGIDVGGTFTDLFAVNEETSETRTAKVLGTKHRLVESVLGALRQTGIKPALVAEIVHGSTTATNALIERTFPPAAMITTEGFRDTIEIGRQRRERLYDPYQAKERPSREMATCLVSPGLSVTRSKPFSSLSGRGTVAWVSET